MNEVQAKFLRQNRLLIQDEINRDTFLYIREAIILKSAEGRPDLSLHITSNGGNVGYGLDIYDLLRYYPGKKVAIVHSAAFSMAAVILQACDWRAATPHSSVLIHHVNNRSVTLDTLRDPEKQAKFLLRMEADQSKLYQILVGRSGKSAEEIRKTCELDTPMSAQEAIEYGLLDQIIVCEANLQFPWPTETATT